MRRCCMKSLTSVADLVWVRSGLVEGANVPVALETLASANASASAVLGGIKGGEGEEWRGVNDEGVVQGVK